MKKTLQVNALENGTVLDHLPSKKVLKIVRVLQEEEEEHHGMITVGIYLPSKQSTTKGIIKLNNRYLDEKALNKVVILAPDTTLNVIKNYEVVEKKQIELRGIEDGILSCNNPNCITNHETLLTKFSILGKSPLHLRCHYCERSVKEGEIVIR
jgi:aspartate carbamoyltransferase regulatory subunit